MMTALNKLSWQLKEETMDGMKIVLLTLLLVCGSSGELLEMLRQLQNAPFFHNLSIHDQVPRMFYLPCPRMFYLPCSVSCRFRTRYVTCLTYLQCSVSCPLQTMYVICFTYLPCSAPLRYTWHFKFILHFIFTLYYFSWSMISHFIVWGYLKNFFK